MKFRTLLYWIPLLFSPLFGQECEEKKTESECSKETEESDKGDECKDDEEAEKKALPIGILAFPTSQQLSPFISFGQNILDQGQFQPGYFGDAFLGPRRQLIDAVPNYIYGISDNLSIYVELPAFAPYYHDRNSHTSSLEDTVVQLEYAYYNNEETYYIDQATFVGALIFPSGSASVTPPTGFGSTAIFLGTTLSRTGTLWYYFTSFGAVFMSSQEGMRTGNLYLYQMGIGRWITTLDDWLICWLLEFDGQYQEHNKFRHRSDLNSGGSVLYVTPSIWVSNCNWRFQFGAGYAVQQHLFGNQSRHGALLVMDITYTFY